MIKLKKLIKENYDKNIIINIWKECIKKALGFGDIDVPAIKISNGKSYYATFQYPRNGNFYDDFKNSILFVTKMAFDNDLEKVIQHEFTHCIMWKEYPNEKQSHGQKFISVHKAIFNEKPIMNID